MREIKQTDLTRLTAGELRATVSALIGLSTHIGPLSQLANSASGVWQMILEQTIAAVTKNRARAVAAKLLAGSNENVSAEQGYRLFDLAAAVMEDRQAYDYISNTPVDPCGWKKFPATSPFRQEMERFLADFGHRSVYEVEIANARWNEDPTYILEQVRLLLDSSSDLRGRAVATRASALDELRGFGRLVRPIIQYVAGKARHASAQRELAKSAMVAVLEPMRMLFKEVGSRLVAAGRLAHVEDVFYLTWPDVIGYLGGEWDGKGAQAIADDNRAQRELWLDQPAADVVVSEASTEQVRSSAAVNEGPEQQQQFGRSGEEVLTGIAAAAGIVTGRARLLVHPYDGERLLHGDILVAPSTDPGWTPLFTRAGGIVMEVGGYQSHGAIVAREFGIPAVVNVANVMIRIKDGDIITVDGESGTVTVKRRAHSSEL